MIDARDRKNLAALTDLQVLAQLLHYADYVVQVLRVTNWVNDTDCEVEDKVVDAAAWCSACHQELELRYKERLP